MSAKKILIIEDDNIISLLMSRILSTKGFEVSLAQNGLDALKEIEQNGLPDLILTDMVMPIMDGWAFAKEFHERYDEKVPLIVVTAAADAEKRSKEIKAVDWIAKPFMIDDLIKIINQHLP